MTGLAVCNESRVLSHKQDRITGSLGYSRRTVRLEERQAHRLTCGLFDRARALEVIEARLGESRARMPGDSRSEAKASVIAMRPVFDEE
jgi:hypothetical protein